MKTWLICTCAVLLVLLAGSVQAETHYVNGVEGIKGASLPPPGTYLRIYNVFYTADAVNDANGDEIKQVPLPDGSMADFGFDVEVMAIVPRLIWVSNKKILGGNYAADIALPFISTDLQIDAAGVDDDQAGLGDLYIEPFVIAWHGPRYDAAVGLSVYLPTGDYDVNDPASPGQDMYTGMLTLGGTYYLDAARTWSASLLARYETHSEQDELDLTPGDDFHFEWGVGKSLTPALELGVAGYCQWQVTEDDGDMATDDKDQVFAVGPEVSMFFPQIKMFASLRGLWEFDAEDRSEGKMATLTLTKIF